MPYPATAWVNDAAPDLDAAHLNNIETGISKAPYGPDGASGFVPVGDGSGGWIYEKLPASSIAGYPTDAGKVLRGDGTWLTQPKITTSTLAGGPPGSPVDGDIWLATAVDANGTRWAFQYNSGSASSFKWEFVGGSSLRSDVATSQTTASTTNVDLATAQSVTLSRGGDYDFVWACEGSNNTTGQAIITALTKGGVELVNRGITTAVANNTEDLFGSFRVTGISAADVVKMQYRVTANTGAFMNRSLTVTPVRVS